MARIPGGNLDRKESIVLTPLGGNYATGRQSAKITVKFVEKQNFGCVSLNGHASKFLCIYIRGVIDVIKPIALI